MPEERVDLYWYIPSPGRPIFMEMTPFPVEYFFPNEEDIAWAVCRLCLNLTGPIGNVG